MDSRSVSLRKLLLGRSRAVAETECVRLCAGLADGFAGMIVDQFGPLIVATDYAGDSNSAEPLMTLLRDVFPVRHILVKVRASADGTNTFVIATHGPRKSTLPLVATERGLRFEIGLDPAHDFGLFLDAAKARAYVRNSAQGKRVLNLFSYAGAFGIAAAAGGAIDVTNVDPNKDYLAWSLRNAALNGVAMRVLPDTAQDFLAKHLRRITRDPQRPGFDLVIVDPPAFGVGRGKQRVLRLLWPELFASLRAMHPTQIVLMCNDKSFRKGRSFVDVVEEELGTGYRFERLGTRLDADELDSGEPPRKWFASVEDPYYAEPVVLAGTRMD